MYRSIYMNNGYFNNLLEWRLNNEINGVDFDEFNTYELKFNKCNNYQLSFKDACLLAATNIQLDAAQQNKSIALAMSGGMDSQFIALCFLMKKIPFTAHIIKFDNNINLLDYNLAIDFCNTYNIPYRIHELTILDFLLTDGIKLAIEYGFNSPQFAPHLWLATQMQDDYIVFGGGDCSNLMWNKQGTPNIDTLAEEITSSSTALARLMIVNQIAGCAAFYRYMPEIKVALVNHNITKVWINQIQSLPDALDKFKFIKYMLYEDAFPGKLHGRTKLTGFEFIDQYDRAYVRPIYESTVKSKIKKYNLTLREELNFYNGTATDFIKFK